MHPGGQLADRLPDGVVLETMSPGYAALADGFVQQGEDTVMNMLNFGLWTGAGQSRPIFTWAQGGAVVVWQGEDFHRVENGFAHARHVSPYCLRA